ncbi:NAD(P)H-binding protein [Epilithonimonas vandammei]|uniref:NAD-dependent epimerase/dehydratase family protein n=1 Tax=Epilithonimonas vandammei TaxID=2487072 RepID=A0A3G8YD12_9FLAO|nr:NAD(P)H-binding protein [Epilithonimonas vandammei]AZI40354.1 NAD-dependent epimerase/dehydratase family protein [Epilithonimonas vandammei]
MKALVIGATGATGKDLVKQLCQDSDFDEIDIFVRRRSDFHNEKVKAHLVDFDHPEEWKHLVKGDVAFSCLGTTLKSAGSKENQKVIDYDYQFNFAKAAKENNVQDYILVSAYGASPDSKIFYSRIKGELEEAVKNLKFEKTTIFKPGMLERKNTDRNGEVFGLKIIKFLNKFGLFKSQKPLPTSVLAKAMIVASKIKSNSFSEVKLHSIFSFAEKKTQ